MWQFHILSLFTNSHGDLINLEGVGGGAWSTHARMTAYKNQIPVRLPLVFLMLVFDAFIKGCAKVRRITAGGGECWQPAGWNSSTCVPCLPCLPATGAQAPALPTLWCYWFSSCCWQESWREEWRPPLGLPPEMVDCHVVMCMLGYICQGILISGLDLSIPDNLLGWCFTCLD